MHIYLFIKIILNFLYSFISKKKKIEHANEIINFIEIFLLYFE